MNDYDPKVLDRKLIFEIDIENPERTQYVNLVSEALHVHADWLTTQWSSCSAFENGEGGVGQIGEHQATDNVKIKWHMLKPDEEVTFKGVGEKFPKAEKKGGGK